MKTCYVGYDHRAIADLVKPGELTADWTITRINVPPGDDRGKGYGSKLLDSILEDADTERVILQLEVSSSDGLTYDQLVNWYKRRGFRQTNTGYMKRMPK